MLHFSMYEYALVSSTTWKYKPHTSSSPTLPEWMHGNPEYPAKLLRMLNKRAGQTISLPHLGQQELTSLQSHLPKYLHWHPQHGTTWKYIIRNNVIALEETIINFFPSPQNTFYSSDKVFYLFLSFNFLLRRTEIYRFVWTSCLKVCKNSPFRLQTL